MNARAPGTLRTVVRTLVPESGEDLADRVAAKIALLPRRADRAELERLLGLFELGVVNLLLAGIPRAFTGMGEDERARYLRGWATSRLALRRKAFQALKRLTAVVHYTATKRDGTNPAWQELRYPGPLGPPPDTPKPITPLAIQRETTIDCDVVVIGSGAGGGVVAAELAAAGKDVVVLEKGGYANEADFTHREGEALERMYDASGLLATQDLGLVILQGSTLEIGRASCRERV